MMIMEMILNKIIDLDNQAKSKILTIKEKEENIETYVSEKIEKEKALIDSRISFKKKKLQEKYDLMLEQEKTRLDEEKNRQIAILHEKYEQEKQKIIEQTINQILNKEI